MNIYSYILTAKKNGVNAMQALLGVVNGEAFAVRGFVGG